MVSSEFLLELQTVQGEERTEPSETDEVAAPLAHRDSTATVSIGLILLL